MAIDCSARAPLRCPPPQTLYMDCANGVGADKMRALATHLADAGLSVDLRNTGEGVLNGGCGSDFLQKDRQLPANFGDVAPGARCCAVDGDADRLMYFTPLEGGSQGRCRGGGPPGRLGCWGVAMPSRRGVPTAGGGLGGACR